MARPKQARVAAVVTHRFEYDPAAVADGVQVWTCLLAEALRRRMAGTAPPGRRRPA